MPGEKLRYPGRNYLFAPGPTHIPVVVQNAMNTPMEDHRAPDFPSLVKPILRDLKKVFLTILSIREVKNSLKCHVGHLPALNACKMSFSVQFLLFLGLEL